MRKLLEGVKILLEEFLRMNGANAPAVAFLLENKKKEK
jgi:hypothetical protein